MFVAFHADAYFYLRGEVLLYFSVWVEVIEIVNLIRIRIQISLEFRKDLKNKSRSHFSIGRGLKLPHRPSLVLVLSPVHSPRSGPKQFHHARPGRPRHHWPEDDRPTEFIPNSYRPRSLQLRIKPNQCGNEFDWRIKIASRSNPLGHKTETPINRRP
jgi:hypothetical protein